MTIKVFGQLTDIFNKENVTIENVKNINELREQLLISFPALAEKSYAIAVGRKIIHENISLYPDSEIALLPPFSGG